VKVTSCERALSLPLCDAKNAYSLLEFCTDYELRGSRDRKLNSQNPMTRGTGHAAWKD